MKGGGLLGCPGVRVFGWPQKQLFFFSFFFFFFFFFVLFCVARITVAECTIEQHILTVCAVCMMQNIRLAWFIQIFERDNNNPKKKKKKKKRKKRRHLKISINIIPPLSNLPSPLYKNSRCHLPGKGARVNWKPNILQTKERRKANSCFAPQRRESKQLRKRKVSKMNSGVKEDGKQAEDTAEWQNDRRMSKHVPRLRKKEGRNRNTEKYSDVTCLNVLNLLSRFQLSSAFTSHWTHREPFLRI